MTHEELVDIAIVKDLNKLIRKQMKAIDAVFKLHKPVMQWSGGYDAEENPLYAEQCNDCSSNGFTQEYPCQTIEAIKKELS